VVVAHEDISPLRCAQERALHSEQRFSDLFEFAPDAIVLANREGHIVQANRQAERMFGWTREELAGQPIEMLVPSDPREGQIRLRQEVLNSASTKTGSFGRPDLRAQRKDGTTFPMSINLSPLDAAEGVLVAAFVRDTTERAQAERYARRSQRLEAIGTLAGGVAHDVNNALAPILMVVEMLRMQYPSETELLDTLQTSAKRVADMVRQLLTFAKGAEGERVSVQLKHLLKEMANIIKGTFPKNIQLEFKHNPKLPTVLGDATQLHQVLLNLCVNARDAMPDGGSLTLEAYKVEVDAAFASTTPDAKPGRYVALRVHDTGPGIPPDIIDRIFDPFFTTKAPDKGSGLGLSTVMGIVKGHGGFLQVYSRPRQGSTFTVYLPAEVVESTTQFISSAHAEYHGQGQLLLFVDDEPSVRDAARAVLRALNFKPETATDGADALIKAIEHRAELHAIVTDLHMPEMDGLAFVRALRRILPNIPVVIASGRLEDSTAKELRDLGVSVRLDKPFTQSQLAEALRAALEDLPDVSTPP
jgi:PAS domain S-box-containing protein